MGLKDVSKSVGSTLYRQIGRASSQVQTQRSLPVDVLESEESYLVVFDTPGAEKEDVQVRYIDGAVKVRIDRFRQFYDGYEMRFPGRGMALDGEFELPEDAIVSPDAGTARLTERGTLQIELPKSEDDDVDGSDEGEDAESEQLAVDE